MQPFMGVVRAAASVTLWSLCSGLLCAGDEPVSECGERASGTVHGHGREVPFADRNRDRGPDVYVRGGREQADAAGIIFGLGTAMGAANFLAWLF